MQATFELGRRAMKIVRVIAAVWVISCFIVMTVAIWAQVGGRYVFNYSIAWTGELATIAQIWMVLVGAGIAARHNMHARIDVLLNLFPLFIRRALTLITLALGLWFLAAIIIGAVPLLTMGKFQTTPAMGISLLVPYLGLIIGPIYFAVELCAATARNWSLDGQAEPDDAAETSV